MTRLKTQDSQGRWRCSRCEQWKPPEDFYRHDTSTNGLMSHCKECHRKATNDRANANREKNRAQMEQESRDQDEAEAQRLFDLLAEHKQWEQIYIMEDQLGFRWHGRDVNPYKVPEDMVDD